jgi:hypothetical protein
MIDGHSPQTLLPGTASNLAGLAINIQARRLRMHSKVGPLREHASFRKTSGLLVIWNLFVQAAAAFGAYHTTMNGKPGD